MAERFALRHSGSAFFVDKTGSFGLASRLPKRRKEEDPGHRFLGNQGKEEDYAFKLAVTRD